MSSSIDLVLIKDTLVQLAHEAGELIRSKSGNVTFDDKKNAVDLVTEVDKAVEDLVSTKLRARFPSYQFMGEETYVPGKTVLTDEPTFIVDPIDGTTNFIHYFPYSCISLGFAIDKKPVVGVVYNPFLNLLYTGVKGSGSYLNDEKLPLRNSSAKPLSLQGALVAIEWGSERTGKNFEIKTQTFSSLAKDKSEGGAFAHGFRSLGSAAMNICSVAAGNLDCYWEGGCYAWDVCAGWIILEEAGGRMFGGNSNQWETEVDSRVYLAVRGGHGQEEFVKDFWSHIPGELSY
ncbi:inositol monophosphate 1-phosphatase INM2 [Sugiyamaella lignohabitans]|uniref:Inositol-1-monophosphatase n=1 Tax=Sugiyamaella lignohabitans TaxID=796027 RepID=A0A161HJS4_9ASCO|nr:inositol monophosphate 1-phosphatase INM2 [Sugiyamaella lignohabitans]ANB13027.1 inositol monophosphate 1-phosphatase INM2 [Sugiyamaella lignohabitans]